MTDLSLTRPDLSGIRRPHLPLALPPSVIRSRVKKKPMSNRAKPLVTCHAAPG
jgi:hypothetical protein